MDEIPDSALPEPPAGFRWHIEPRFGFAVTVPRRFALLGNTVDPIARLIRGLGGKSAREEADQRRNWPDGFCDREVLGELEDGRVQPFRLLEFDAVGGRSEPLTDAEVSDMWFKARQLFPETLESVGLPGFALLNVLDTSLGELDALAFEYHWDGLRAGEDGGDHGLLVWAPTPMTVFHAYHHCVETEWAARKRELDAILASFEVLGVASGGEDPHS
jgi:hypothetical protein